MSPALEKRRIERAPSRDPAGETSPHVKENKCSFSGILELSARDMTDAGVLRVECPECLTMRALSLQGDTVRFPSHDKRSVMRRRRTVPNEKGLDELYLRKKDPNSENDTLTNAVELENEVSLWTENVMHRATFIRGGAPAAHGPLIITNIELPKLLPILPSGVEQGIHALVGYFREGRSGQTTSVLFTISLNRNVTRCSIST